MGRSVSTPHNAACVAYKHVEDGFDSEWQWDDLKYDYVEQLKILFPRINECDEWVGREDHAIAENSFAYFGLSEYCGLVAFWIAEKDCEYPGLQARWIENAAHAFECSFGELTKLGTASNGETFFERKAS